MSCYYNWCLKDGKVICGGSDSDGWTDGCEGDKPNNVSEPCTCNPSSDSKCIDVTCRDPISGVNKTKSTTQRSYQQAGGDGQFCNVYQPCSDEGYMYTGECCRTGGYTDLGRTWKVQKPYNL